MSNLIECLQCGKKVSADIRVCPNCFSNLGTQYRNKTQNLELAKRENIKTIVLFLLWLLAIVVIFTAIVAISGADSNSLGSNLRSVSGWVMLIGGILITPFIRDFIEEDFGERVSRTIVNVTGGALSIIGLVGFIFSISILNKEESAYLTANPEVAEVEVEVEADSMKVEEQSQPEPIAEDVVETVNVEQSEPVTNNNTINNDDSVQSGVVSQSADVDFAACMQQQNEMTAMLLSSGNYRVIPIVQNGFLSIVRFCANDGSVLHTCSGEDRKMVVTMSPNQEGC
jgi:hypothetical protein